MEKGENRVYLDYAATTPLDEAVLDAMMPYFREDFGNASSQHAFGRRAVAAVDEAREKTAKVLGARSNEIYFTSGGTESDNWAIRGVAKAMRGKGKHIISTAVEHHAVLHTLRDLEAEGYEVTYLPVDDCGRVSVEDAVAAMREDTILLSVMLANNEIGTIEPVGEIARAAKERGILVHTDAVQAVGLLPLAIDDLCVDLMSLSAHKFYGPKGVGALYVRKGTKLGKILTGGAQERTMRGGTYNTAGIVGLGKAIELAEARRTEEVKRLTALRDHFVSRVLSEIEFAKLNGGKDRLANNANIAFRYIEGADLVSALDRAGIAASAGSACASGTLEPSHVLQAIGVSSEYGAVRFSLGKYTTKEDVDHAADILFRETERLRKTDLFARRSAEKVTV
ncbi:MAG: IscS subfamily cysteine desulfurase [Clostridia bacterium]|nr:IscS subfamily cysteine desulfurase [Clostridia bacterium]